MVVEVPTVYNAILQVKRMIHTQENLLHFKRKQALTSLPAKHPQIGHDREYNPGPTRNMQPIMAGP